LIEVKKNFHKIVHNGLWIKQIMEMKNYLGGVLDGYGRVGFVLDDESPTAFGMQAKNKN
jgi:hypothetical protein